MATKRKKKPIKLQDLLGAEELLESKRAKAVSEILSFVRKEAKKGKLKTLVKQLDNLEGKLKELGKAIKKEKKAALKIEKQSKAKKKPKAKKLKAETKETKSKKAATPATKVPTIKPERKAIIKAALSTNTAGSKSTDFNAKMAIAQLPKIPTRAAVEAFITGEKRGTVLSRANSRLNALASD